MNLIRHNAKKLTAAIFLLITCSSLLVACGGSESETTAGIGGTGIVSGKITGFGSIHVNGGKFEIDNSLFDVDGDTFVGQAGQDALSVGMVVRLRVETENGVFGNTALEVVYDDEIEGPVAAVTPKVGTTKTITVFGEIITIDETDTLFENTTFLDIEIDDVVEVSGFRVSPTQFNATYVKETAEDVVYNFTEVELRGIIDEYSGGFTFKIGGTVINFDPLEVNTEIEVAGGIDNGIFVEVEGVIQSETAVFAEEIELEDEGFDDDVDEISLEGVVTGFSVGGITNFFVDSQRVNASMAQFSPAGLTLVDGLIIEVEGPIIDSVLIADKVEEE